MGGARRDPSARPSPVPTEAAIRGSPGQDQKTEVLLGEADIPLLAAGSAPELHHDKAGPIAGREDDRPSPEKASRTGLYGPG